MERLTLFLIFATVAACSTASELRAPELSCVPADSCGCRVMVDPGSCPAGGAHFFHELHDGAPLQLSLGQNPVTATALQTETSTFSPEPGDSWVETYRYEGGEVEIRYSPAPTTCSKLAHGEQCEFFDVRAQVLITEPQGVTKYSGVGTCGC